MDVFLLLAYITGGILIAYTLMLYIFPSRKLNLLLKAGGNFLTVINLIFVYLATRDNLVFAGMATTAICIAREILFSFKEEKKALNHIAWPIGFSIILSLSLIFTYKSPLSLLPVVGSVISTMFFYISNRKLFKTGAIISSVLYVTYYAVLLPSSGVLTIFSLLCAIMGLVSAIVGLIILFAHKEKK